MMTGQENTARLFAGEPAERVGVMDSIWRDTLRMWLTQSYPSMLVTKTLTKRVQIDGVWTDTEVEEEVRDAAVTPAEHFDFDMQTAGGNFDIMPLRGHSEVVDETDEWIIRRNGAGAALKHWKNKSGTPEHVDFWMTSREIWDRDYRPHLLEPDPERVNVEATCKNVKTLREQKRFVFFGQAFIWENMRKTMGDVCMYESLALDPEWIHDFNRVYTDFYKAHYKILFEKAGLPDGIWLYEDLGYNKGLFCSPKTLEELIFPYYREIVDFLHSYGLRVVLHSCGSAHEALPLIVEAGFDALNPMERAARNDPLEYAEKYGDDLVFIGGLDKRIVETHDRALIRKEVTALVNGMKERGARYVFASDHSISTNTNYEDFAYMLEVYREHMLY